MTRTVLALVVLAQRHHIEGVCKPWSAATLAARAAAERAAVAAAELLAKSRLARAERASERNAERVARAVAQAGRRPADGWTPVVAATTVLREAITPPPIVVDGIVVGVEQEHRR